MNSAQVTTDAAINTTSGITGDFADFAIAISRRAGRQSYGLPTVRPQIAFFGGPSPALPDLPSSRG
jgi:hypothetical protein